MLGQHPFHSAEGRLVQGLSALRRSPNIKTAWRIDSGPGLGGMPRVTHRQTVKT